MRVRTRRWTGQPIAENMRRTCRLRPSKMVSSTSQRPVPSSSRVTLLMRTFFAGSVIPSESITPWLSCARSDGAGTPFSTALYVLPT